MIKKFYFLTDDDIKQIQDIIKISKEKAADDPQHAKQWAEVEELGGLILKHGDTSRYAVKITKHTGKMSGIPSVSTSQIFNKACKLLSQNKQNICYYCYARKYSKLYKNLDAALLYNTLLLSFTYINPKTQAAGLANFKYVRFESFSDLQNMQHFYNLYQIAKYFNETNFALWTKRHLLVFGVMSTLKPLKNLNFILSNFRLNDKGERIKDLFIAKFESLGINPKNLKYFNVFESDFAWNNNIEINCGARSCASCLKCYKRNNIQCINELKK